MFYIIEFLLFVQEKVEWNAKQPFTNSRPSNKEGYPAVTRSLGFCGLIQRAIPFSRHFN